MAKEEKTNINQVENQQGETVNPETSKTAENIILEATKKAEEILARAEKAANKISGGETLPYDKRPEILAEIKRGEDSIEVNLFKDNDKYKDDVYAAIGGSNILIKRGISVKIPKKYDAIIKQAQKQNKIAMAYVESLAGRNVEVK